jgi:Tfp pilus assembly protein PilF
MQSQLRRRYWQIATSILLVSLLSYGLRVSLFNEEPPAKNLLSLADDYYHQIRLADNEMAISLYQQHITLHPDSGAAYAGLANSLVQKALRWSGTQDNKGLSLTGKVAAGALADEASQQQLLRARALAEKALALQPDSATTLKALGFVLSAQGDYNEAIAVYQQALQADPQAWQVQLNIGELYQATGNMPQALLAYEAAFNAMSERYHQQEVQIRPWIADMGSMLGDHYLNATDWQTAESWYRRVISFAPLHEQATLGLARVLHATGDTAGALQLCQQLNQRLQKDYQCQAVISG